MATEAVTTDKTKSAQTGQLMQRSAKSIKHEMSEKLNDVKYMIDMHLNEIHGSVSDGAKRTIAFVQMMQEKHELNANSTLVKINGKKSTIKMNSALKSLAKIWKEMKPKHSHPEVSVSFEFSDETSNENDAKSTLVPKVSRGQSIEFVEWSNRFVSIHRSLAFIRKLIKSGDRTSSFNGHRKR